MNKLAIGRIRTSHGVKGYLKVSSYSGETGHFLTLKDVILRRGNREKRFDIEDVRVLGNDVVMFKFEGLDTPEEAKHYSGWDIWVDKDLASPLRDGEYYIHDLVGCSLIFNGKTVGIVEMVTDNSVNDLLTVSTGSASCIIPFRDEYIGDVNLQKKIIELKDDGLLS